MAKKKDIRGFDTNKKNTLSELIRTRTLFTTSLSYAKVPKQSQTIFEAFNKTNQGTYVFNLQFDGGGISTTKVVDKAIELRDKVNKAKKPYDRVWAVFDNDSFSEGKFYSSLQKADNNNIGCAWSNEAFELWFLLHLYDKRTSMRRDEYKNDISNADNQSPKYKSRKVYRYEKNSTDIHRIMNTYGSQSDAIRRAEALEKDLPNHSYARHNPCTTVYKLIIQLIGNDDVLNN